MAGGAPRPRLLFLVTEDWYFWSHRLPVARAARDAGFEVVVATRVKGHGDRIRAEGFRLVPLEWDRGTRTPWRALSELATVVRLYRRERPDLAHHIAVKPAVFGAVAAMATGLPAMVTTLAGRGFALSGRGLLPVLAGMAVRAVLRLGAIGRRAAVVVQNPEDRAWLRSAPSVPHVRLIAGSGVDLGRYLPLPDPDGPFTVAQVSRMLALKGVEDAVEAVRRLRAEGLDMRLLLAGASDADNPAAIPPDRLAAWAEEGGVEWLGPVPDVRQVWARAHVALLASRGGEGVPKTLLEAAACGRPIVATYVAGTRDVARGGVNAVLIPPNDPEALANALRLLACDPAYRARLAQASRSVVDPAFGDDRVAERTLALYRRLVAKARAPAPVGR